MKRLTLGLSLAALGLCLNVSSVRADQKTYQVTGPVLEVNANYIVVKKGSQNWQIATTPSTKSDTVKVGDKVTIYYTMTATEIDLKTSKSAKSQ